LHDDHNMLRRVLGTCLTRTAKPKRLTPNMYAPIVSKLVEKYGKYSEYFETPGDPLKKYDDKADKHKTQITFDFDTTSHFRPHLAPELFIAPNATIAGNVELWARTSVWYGAVIKGDHNLVRIGQCSNIQDNTVIHEAFNSLAPDHDGSTIVGHYCTIGHGCYLSGCTIEDQCLVGSRSVLTEGAYMEFQSQLGAGSVLSGRVPSGQLWAGNPAKYIRDLTIEEKARFREDALTYLRLARTHKGEFYLDSTLYEDAEKEGLDFQFPCPFYGKD